MLFSLSNRLISWTFAISILSSAITPVFAISDQDFKAVTEAHRLAYRTYLRLEILPKGVVPMDESEMDNPSEEQTTYMRFRDVLRWKRERALHDDMRSFGSENSVDSSRELNEASHGGALYPIEFKKSATPTLSASKSFHMLEKLRMKVGEGAVICLKDTDIPLSQEVMSIPVGYL